MEQENEQCGADAGVDTAGAEESMITPQEGKKDLRSSFVHLLGTRDVILISVTIGIVAIIIPWWGLTPLMYILTGQPYVHVPTENWLPIIGGVLYISGTVLNLRNPMGSVAQVAGIVLFLVEMTSNGSYYEWWPTSETVGLGLYLAVISVVLCFLAAVCGGYKNQSGDS
jgi:hypothetical protein